jgi:hypothetical protein
VFTWPPPLEATKLVKPTSARAGMYSSVGARSTRRFAPTIGKQGRTRHLRLSASASEDPHSVRPGCTTRCRLSEHVYNCYTVLLHSCARSIPDQLMASTVHFSAYVSCVTGFSNRLAYLCFQAPVQCHTTCKQRTEKWRSDCTFAMKHVTAQCCAGAGHCKEC